MDEKSQPVCTLQHLYATSAPIFADGMMFKFGFLQCTSGKSMLLVAPNSAKEVRCPLCGKIHLIPNSFISLSVDEFLERYQIQNFGT